MTIKIVDFDDFSKEDAEQLRAASVEAERGYSTKQLNHAVARRVGRPLSVGKSKATKVVKVRIDNERDAKLRHYMKRHNLTRSAAIRQLLDKALMAS